MASKRWCGHRPELWDADDFDPWDTLRWPTVRVLRYRQHKRDGTVVEASWLTDCPRTQVSSRRLYRFAKSRWEIENEGFNDGKTRHGLAHISHHHPNSLLIGWLLTIFALTIERLYRLRYLHRGTHRPATAVGRTVSAPRIPAGRRAKQPGEDSRPVDPLGNVCRASVSGDRPAPVPKRLTAHRFN